MKRMQSFNEINFIFVYDFNDLIYHEEICYLTYCVFSYILSDVFAEDVQERTTSNT